MNPLLILGVMIGLSWLLFGSSAPRLTGERLVFIGANKYLVKPVANGTSIVAYDVQGRAILVLTYGQGGIVVDESVLGDFPDTLVQYYHNQAVAEITQYPEKFGL